MARRDPDFPGTFRFLFLPQSEAQYSHRSAAYRFAGRRPRNGNRRRNVRFRDGSPHHHIPRGLGRSRAARPPRAASPTSSIALGNFMPHFAPRPPSKTSKILFTFTPHAARLSSNKSP